MVTSGYAAAISAAYRSESNAPSANTGSQEKDWRYAPAHRVLDLQIAAAAVASTWQPRAMSSSWLSSAKSWLMPPILGMNNMAQGRRDHRIVSGRTGHAAPGTRGMLHDGPRDVLL